MVYRKNPHCSQSTAGKYWMFCKNINSFLPANLLSIIFLIFHSSVPKIIEFPQFCGYLEFSHGNKSRTHNEENKQLSKIPQKQPFSLLFPYSSCAGSEPKTLQPSLGRSVVNIVSCQQRKNLKINRSSRYNFSPDKH